MSEIEEGKDRDGGEGEGQGKEKGGMRGGSNIC